MWFTVLLAVAVAEPTPPPGLRLRVDPFVTLVAGGASVGFDLLPAQTNPDSDLGSRLSVAVFVVDVPRFLVPLVLDAEPSLKLTETAVQVGWFTSFSPDHTGFFAGPEIYAYQLRYAFDDDGRIDVAHELYVHATVGWVVFPFAGDGGQTLADDFFVMPWATVGLPVWKTGGALFADGSVIDDRVANWHATVSVGLQLF